MRWFSILCRALLAATFLTIGGPRGTEVVAAPPDSPPAYNPPVAAASAEPEQALRSIRGPQGLRIEVHAAEPLVANPVAFTFDERGRLFVAETFRLHKGVTDARQHMYWLADDLASRTVADRVAMYRKHLGREFDDYGKEHDRIRLVEDKDGDGRADHAVVFADGFHDAAVGLGAGILVRRGDVYYTCIPDLWRLRDRDGDGKADARESLHHGYGVHVGFLGHDLHGLRFGPDGRLYFTMGDRGLNVTTGDGRTVRSLDTGAVLRCDPDGRNLEIIATGLRNPQELAFDDFGNLFTVDNNSDSGDKARLVYIVDGGDSGWRIGYQFLRQPVSRGPWNDEKLWHLAWDGQAAHILPPLAHISDGPSGLTYEPGATRLPDRYRRHFFLADFRGTPSQSGVRSFAVKPKGASFEMTDAEEFLWGLAATDVEFSPDGALYVSDWVEGWRMTMKGRIFKVFDPEHDVGDVRRTWVALRDRLGRSSIPLNELSSYLAAPDMRVRQEAQFALAARGAEAVPILRATLQNDRRLMPRIHAIWALGQIGRSDPAVIDHVTALLDDGDAEVRAQAVRTAGEAGRAGDAPALVRRLGDASPRVRLFAAIGLGKIGRAARSAAGPLVALLRENQDADLYLRHAAVMGLTGVADGETLRATAADRSASVRMGVLLAMRRLQSPEIARFLDDPEPRLAREAARAIYDVPIEGALPTLAARIERPAPGADAPLLRRVINAAARRGTAADAAGLARLAAERDVPESVRVEALQVLGAWPAPPGIDRVTGLWRPTAARPADDASRALSPLLAPLLRAAPDPVRVAALKALGPIPVSSAGQLLLDVVTGDEASAEVRAEALRALERLGDPRLAQAVERAAQDKAARVRIEAQRLRAKLQPAEALPMLKDVLERGTIAERQGAMAALRTLPGPDADAVVALWLNRLQRGDVPPEIIHELLEAARSRPAALIASRLRRYEESHDPDDPLAPYLEALAGGDAERGETILREKDEVSCVRCHKVNGQGGEVGPDLTGIGKRQDRRYLLEAIVAPNRQIAQGFETLVIATSDGQVQSGILKEDDGTNLRLMTAEGKLLNIPKAEIEEQKRGASAMPQDLLKQLSRSELRDLVEYLAGLK
jgi:quinoprotein glucose dehydrogenase